MITGTGSRRRTARSLVPKVYLPVHGPAVLRTLHKLMLATRLYVPSFPVRVHVCMCVCVYLYYSICASAMVAHVDNDGRQRARGYGAMSSACTSRQKTLTPGRKPRTTLWEGIIFFLCKCTPPSHLCSFHRLQQSEKEMEAEKIPANRGDNNVSEALLHASRPGPAVPWAISSRND